MRHGTAGVSARHRLRAEPRPRTAVPGGSAPGAEGLRNAGGCEEGGCCGARGCHRAGVGLLWGSCGAVMVQGALCGAPGPSHVTIPRDSPSPFGLSQDGGGGGSGAALQVVVGARGGAGRAVRPAGGLGRGGIAGTGVSPPHLCPLSPPRPRGAAEGRGPLGFAERQLGEGGVHESDKILMEKVGGGGRGGREGHPPDAEVPRGGRVPVPDA